MPATYGLIWVWTRHFPFFFFFYRPAVCFIPTWRPLPIADTTIITTATAGFSHSCIWTYHLSWKMHGSVTLETIHGKDKSKTIARFVCVYMQPGPPPSSGVKKKKKLPASHFALGLAGTRMLRPLRIGTEYNGDRGGDFLKLNRKRMGPEISGRR